MFYRFWYRIRRIGWTTSMKVYLAVAVLIVGLTGGLIWASGAIQKNSFDALYSEDKCLIEKAAFDISAVEHISVDEIDNPDLLTPVRFLNHGKGNGKWGFIDEQGRIVIDGVFEQKKFFYGGYIEFRTGNSYRYVDRYLDEIPVKEAVQKYVKDYNLDRNWHKTKTSEARMLLKKDMFAQQIINSRFAIDLINEVEAEIGLQIDYINIFSLPFRYYAVRFLSFEHPVVYGYFDENFQQIGDQLYFNELYVNRSGIVKVDIGCGWAYLNADGKTIWQEDYEAPSK